MFLALIFLYDALLTILNVDIMNPISRNHQTTPFTCKYRTIKSKNTTGRAQAALAWELLLPLFFSRFFKV